MSAQTNLTKIYEAAAFQWDIKRRLTGRGTSAMFVRNPYSRLVSFYTDKFRKNPRWLSSEGYRKEWQYCQTIFFPKLGLTDSCCNDTIFEAMQSTTFVQFMGMLGGLAHKDGHLQPQSKLLRFFPLPGLSFHHQVDKLLKIENPDHDFVQNRLQIDLSIHKHRTGTGEKFGDYFDSRTFAIANRIYKEDFQAFQYRMY